MKKEILPIKGMYCENCATRITQKLNALSGVVSCHTDFQQGKAIVQYDNAAVTRETLCACVRDLGYEVAVSEQAQIISILIILMALYLIANHLGLLAAFHIFPVVETTMSYGALFLIGLLTGFHCLAMCGGINLTQSMLSAKRRESVWVSNLLYNLGRVVSYTLIGGIAGLLGGAVGFAGRGRGIVLMLTGLAMLIMSLRTLGIFRYLRRLRLPDGVYRLCGGLLKSRSGFVIGLLNGFMPCGPLQSMQIYALSTGSFVPGALSMFLFSLGTMPTMFGFGAIAGRLNRQHAHIMMAVSALLIFMMGLGMIGNGLSLFGISASFPQRETENRAVLNGERQAVRSIVDYGYYEPITVRQAIPVDWTIFVPEGRLNGCNREIIVDAYSLNISLHEGDNLVTFTPKKTGVIPYTCWMGMIRSSIRVE